MLDRVLNLLTFSNLGALLFEKFLFLADLEGRTSPSSSITIFFLLLAVGNYGFCVIGEERDLGIGGGWNLVILVKFSHMP